MSEGVKALIESLEGEVDRVRKEADEQIAHFEERIEELNITWAAGHGFAVGRRAAFDSEAYATWFAEKFGSDRQNMFRYSGDVIVDEVNLDGDRVYVKHLNNGWETSIPIDMAFPNLDPYIEKVERLRLDEPEQAMSAIRLVIWGDLREKVKAVTVYGGVDRPTVVHVAGMVFKLQEVDDGWQPARVKPKMESSDDNE